MKLITYRISNVTYENGIAKAQVEAKANEPLKLFGINFRFFYDTRLFVAGKSGGLKLNLPEGYRQYNLNYGDSPSGWVAFGSTGPITYFNGAVELVDSTKALDITTEWAHVLELELKKKPEVNGLIYPPFIWDKKFDPSKGGFMNSPGITTTEYLTTDETGVLRTGPLVSTGENYNWDIYPNATKYPWGMPASDTGLTV